MNGIQKEELALQLIDEAKRTLDDIDNIIEKIAGNKEQKEFLKDLVDLLYN